MPSLPLAFPTYQLRSKASPARVINWVPVLVESQQGRQTAYLKQVPGLTLYSDLHDIAGATGAIRFLGNLEGSLYAVCGSKFYKIGPLQDLTYSPLGTLLTASGNVEGVANGTGQAVLVDGTYGYTADLAGASPTDLTQITDPYFLGSADVDVLDGYGVFSDPGTNTFYTSDLNDFSTGDPLNIVSIEGIPGNIVGHIAKGHEIYIFKSDSGEVWYNEPQSSGFPFTRNSAAAIEVGCSAAATIRKIGGVIYWLGRDENGQAMVFGMSAYSPQRISSHALEEALNAIPVDTAAEVAADTGDGVQDLSAATAFVYQEEGLTFYVLNHPQLKTTWCYEVSSGIWHQRAEWPNGELAPWRVTHHAFAYGRHFVGDANGKIYVLDQDSSDNDGDTLIRDLITPETPNPSLQRIRYSSIEVDCDVGQGLSTGLEAKLMCRYSDDAGKTWSNWKYLSLGVVGNYAKRVRATMLGSSRHRVWNFRVTDPVNCSLIQAVFNES